MSQSGGSATINGILYQLLGAIDRAVNIRLQATWQDGDIVDPTLVIEPVGGGGDLRIYFPHKQIVEQWKAKSDHGTWSLQEVITAVIPDLYLAVHADRLDDQSEYTFVTEGRRGTWSAAQAFFRGLKQSPTPDDPLSLLDAVTKVAFFPQQLWTQHELFLHIAAEVRKRALVREEEELLTYRKLWHLLARFTIKQDTTHEQMEAGVNQFLRAVVDYREDVDEKRQQLCGLLLELAAQGEVSITPKKLRQRAGLNAVAVHHWSALKTKLPEELHRQAHSHGYDPAFDVRAAPTWQSDMPILLLAGESGQGKTWQLLQVALAACEGDGVGVLATQQEDAKQVLQAAADLVWKTGLNHGPPLSLDRVARWIRHDLVPTPPQPWLTLCVDDVQTSNMARWLIEPDWSGWGIRLAMTVPLELGRILKGRHPERVQLVEVPDFTAEQLREYLRRRERQWHTIPPDVRETLTRPILAGLYCDLTHDASWVPTTEYDLFARYGLRLRDAREQYDFPGDLGKMRALAGQLLREGSVYPWPRRIVEQVGIKDDAPQRRLESLGWLRRRTDDRVEVWHDRLLNWAVAEFLVEQRQSQESDTATLGAWLARLHGNEERFAGRFLGYVPMDVLWLASEPERGLIGEVPQLIAALEGNNAAGGSADALYRRLLPTLGERILPVLKARFRTLEAQADPISYAQLLTLALKGIGKRFPRSVQTYAVELLKKPVPSLPDVGMRVLAEFPSVAALDDLWELHKQHVRQLAASSSDDEQESRGQFLYKHDLSFSALRAGTNLDPDWLARAIHQVDAQTEPVWELAYLMANLNVADAKTRWLAVKPLLFAKMPRHKSRSLSTCLRHLRDAEETPRLEQWLSEKEDLAFGAALAALVVIDPDRALHHLGGLPRGELSLLKSWWFPELLNRRRAALNEKLLELAQRPGADVWDTVRLYQGDSNEMDGQTLEFLLNTLASQLAEEAPEQAEGIFPRVRLTLEVLAKISRPTLLGHLETRAHSQLEDRLTSAACARVDRAGLYFDHDLHHARLLLLKMGGHGLTTLVNHELASPHVHVQITGLAWVLVRPNTRTRKLLRDIATDERLAEIDNGRYAQSVATKALAALHEDEAVVDAVLRRGVRTPEALTEWWSENATVSDERLRRAQDALSGEDPRFWPGAIMTVGFSKRKDLIPRIRTIVAKAKTNSHVALAATIAFRAIKDATPETLRFLQEHLSTSENPRHAVNALLHIGTPEALGMVEDYFLKTAKDPTVLRKIGIAIGLVLARDPKKRAWVATTLWSALKNHPPLLWTRECLELMGDVDEQETREWLLEQAFPAGANRASKRFVAIIRAVAKFDPAQAYEAARLALEMDGDREEIPQLLVDVNAPYAISTLCEGMAREQSTLVRWAIGRALRRVKESTLVQETLDKMAHDPDWRVRQAAAELCGWQDNATVETVVATLASDDLKNEVRAAASEALRRQRDHAEVRHLFEEFMSAHETKRWGILEAIIELADPLLLCHRADSVWIGHILEKSDVALWDHAEQRLKEREKELRSKAEQQDRNHKSGG